MKDRKKIYNKKEVEKKPILITEPKTNLEIVQEVLDSRLLEDCVGFQLRKVKMTEPDKYRCKKDMFQDMVVWLLTYDNDKLNDAYRKNHMNALITRILINQIFSKASKFFRDYIDFPRRTIFGEEYCNYITEDGERGQIEKEEGEEDC